MDEKEIKRVEEIKRLKDWEEYYMKCFQITGKKKYRIKVNEIVDRLLELHRLQNKTLNIESHSLNKYPAFKNFNLTEKDLEDAKEFFGDKNFPEFLK